MPQCTYPYPLYWPPQWDFSPSHYSRSPPRTVSRRTSKRTPRIKSPNKSQAKKQTKKKDEPKPNRNKEGPNFLTPKQMEKRLGQILIGKQTTGYKNYRAVVPKNSRTADHPKTPDQTEIISKRRFDGKLRVWRNALHEFDQIPPLTLLPTWLAEDAVGTGPSKKDKSTGPEEGRASQGHDFTAKRKRSTRSSTTPPR